MTCLGVSNFYYTIRGYKVKIRKLRFRFHLHRKLWTMALKCKIHSVQTKINVKYNIDTSFTIHFKKAFWYGQLAHFEYGALSCSKVPSFSDAGKNNLLFTSFPCNMTDILRYLVGLFAALLGGKAITLVRDVRFTSPWFASVSKFRSEFSRMDSTSDSNSGNLREIMW